MILNVSVSLIFIKILEHANLKKKKTIRRQLHKIGKFTRKKKIMYKKY